MRENGLEKLLSKKDSFFAALQKSFDLSWKKNTPKLLTLMGNHLYKKNYTKARKQNQVKIRLWKFNQPTLEKMAGSIYWKTEDT